MMKGRGNGRRMEADGGWMMGDGRRWSAGGSGWRVGGERMEGWWKTDGGGKKGRGTAHGGRKEEGWRADGERMDAA